MPKAPTKHAPLTLEVMQLVRSGQTPRTPSGIAYQKLYDANPIKFLDRLTVLETAYYESQGKFEWDGQGACPCCGRGSQSLAAADDAAIRQAEEWLRQEGERDPGTGV